MRKRRLTINKVRSGLYKSAKILGDVQAVTSKKENAVAKRIGRRIIGRFFGQILGALFK